jgi:hypothetical protein
MKNLDMSVLGAQGTKRHARFLCSWANAHVLGSGGGSSKLGSTVQAPLVSSLKE